MFPPQPTLRPLRLHAIRLPPHRTLSSTPRRSARPDGVSDRERAHLQALRVQAAQYRRWRRRVVEEPYRALFGASEDMLRGKGLGAWIPEWMLEPEAEGEGRGTGKGNGNGNGRKGEGREFHDGKRGGVRDGARFTGRVDVEGGDKDGVKNREPAFREPEYKPKIFEHEDFGIVSPSDLRRPREEGSHVKVVGKEGARGEVSGRGGAVQPPLSKAAEPVKTEELKEKVIHLDPVTPESNSSASRPVASTTPKSSFVNDFFADKPQKPVLDTSDPKDGKSWRQTTLQRRMANEVMAKSTAVPLPAVSPAAQTTLPVLQGAFTIPSSQAIGDILYGWPKSTSLLVGSQAAVDKPAPVEPVQKDVVENAAKSTQSTKTAASEQEKVDSSPAPTRSTSAILGQLPKDDEDLLTAADLRAIMAGKRAALKGIENKELARQKLEKEFTSTQQKELDPVIESNIVNDQFVRRTERAMQDAHRAKSGYTESPSYQQDTPISSAVPAPMESSVDRMKRWIEEGGSSLSKHFWQDPIDESGPSQHDLQFLKQSAGFGKGRRAVVHIVDDLKKDLPVSCELLDTLDRDQSRVEQALHLLRHPKPTKYQVEVSKSLRLIKERRLRRQFEETEKQFDTARKALRELQNTSAATSASNAFKNRIDVASKIFHKNATLTRTLMWAAQARLEDPDANRGKVELYSEVLSRMTTLRDTQLALARLVDYAMQVYGVVPKPIQEFAPSVRAQDTASSPAGQQTQIPSIQANTPALGPMTFPSANTHLDNEVRALKSAMQGLSDDGYARAPKQRPAKILETPNPLAHSLFRPFGLQLESLAKEPERDVTAETLREGMRKKESDRALVEEIRKAYEDTYGEITVEHTQASGVVGEGEGESRSFEVSKEDPVEVKEVQVDEPVSTSETAALNSDSSGVSPESMATTENASTVLTPLPESTQSTEPPSATTSTESTEPTPTDLPTNYTILLHDPQTDTLTVTTSTTTTPNDTTPPIPLHTALATLTTPSKFLPHIPPSHQIITAKPDMLILRPASAQDVPAFETITTSTSPPAPSPASPSSSPSTVNPIDGTVRLSPTGYVGVPETQESLDREFAERRGAAARTRTWRGGQERGPEGGKAKGRSRGGLGAVVRTAIWAGAACYVVGVLGEVAR